MGNAHDFFSLANSRTPFSASSYSNISALFEKHFSVKLTTNDLRKCVVDYFLSLPASGDHTFATSFFPSSLREMRWEIRYARKEAGHVSYISDTLHLFLLSHLSVSVINLFIQAAALIHVLPYSLTIPFFFLSFIYLLFLLQKCSCHIKALCSLTLFTTNHISLSLVERKINDDNSPAFLLVLRYSHSVQSLILLYCHFGAFTFLFIAPAITFLLCTINHGLHSSTALYCHCHQLYVCHHLHTFSVNYQFKPFFIYCTKTKTRQTGTAY